MDERDREEGRGKDRRLIKIGLISGLRSFVLRTMIASSNNEIENSEREKKEQIRDGHYCLDSTYAWPCLIFVTHSTRPFHSERERDGELRH
jgi:hypothetical protein